MSTNNAAHTPGPYVSYEDRGEVYLRETTGLHTARLKTVASQLSVVDARVAAEAFNVRHETGMTPRQLAEQRAELLEALIAFRDGGPSGGKDFAEWHRSYDPAIAKARAAIAKATGSAP